MARKARAYQRSPEVYEPYNEAQGTITKRPDDSVGGGIRAEDALGRFCPAGPLGFPCRTVVFAVVGLGAARAPHHRSPPTLGSVTSIVIVGSGFTGFTCARRLARILSRRHAPVDITIISPVDYMLYTPLLPDVAGGVVDARFVAVPLANSLRGVHAVRGRVDRWTSRNRRSRIAIPRNAAIPCPGTGWCSRRGR